MATILNNGEISVTKLQFDISIFEVVDQKVNLTKMCEHFGKRIDHWKNNKTSKIFLDTLQKSFTDISVIEIKQGGNGEQGTFGTREVALKVAQWISPDFEVFCIKKLDELFQTGKVEIDSTTPKQLSLPELLEQSQNWIFKLSKENEQLKVEVEFAKPAVEFTKQVNNAINSITVADFAKVLGTGEIRLYAWLRENRFLMERPKNRPYQNFIDNGYFRVIEKTYKDLSTAESKTYTQTLITGKGQIYLTKKYLKPNFEIKLIENHKD